MQHSKLHFWSDIPINKPNVLFQKMYIFIDLNHYVKQNVTKTLHPLLVENGCREFKIPTSSWKLEKSLNEPDKEDWEELTKYKLEQTQKRQTIPVHGKLQIQDGNIYLKVYIKYWNLKKVTTEDEINIQKLGHTYRQPCPVVPSAQLGYNQVQYYTCRMLLGNFTKDKLTSRSQQATLNFGVHIQDLRIQDGEKEYKLYKNFRELLTYITKEQYEDSVKFLKGRNREVKLEGHSRRNNIKDPRNWFNDTEIEELDRDLKRLEEWEREEEKRKQGEEMERIHKEKMEKDREEKEKEKYWQKEKENYWEKLERERMKIDREEKENHWERLEKLERGREDKENYWEKQTHYEDPDQYNKLNLGTRPKIMETHLDFIPEKYKGDYKKHEQMEQYTENQTFNEDTPGQLEAYGQRESTPNKTDFPHMENFFKEKEPATNITGIKNLQ